MDVVLRGLTARFALLFRGLCLTYSAPSFLQSVGEVVRHAYEFGDWFSADSAGCPLGRFSHWWRSVWVSVYGEVKLQTSVMSGEHRAIGCQKLLACTLGTLTSRLFESAFFA